MQRFGARYWQFHIKDVPALNAEHDVELGKGVVDFRRLLRTIDHIDEKHLYVEQETYPGLPLESAKRDHAFLTALEF
jgi:sugar phosphate isomerase/epimerase